MLVALLATVGCVVVNIGLHLAVLRLLWRYVRPRVGPMTGIGMAVLVVGCLIGHILEIAVFSLGMFLVAVGDGDTVAALEGHEHQPLDLWWYSAAFYTSLGAQRPPSAGLKIFATTEALTGLILITWTASFLFLLMQKAWSLEDRG